MRDYKVYVRLKREPIYQPCDSTQPPLSGALDLTETNALLVPTLSELTTGIGKGLLFNCTEAVGPIIG